MKQKPYCKQTSCRKNCKLFSHDAIEKTQKNARNYYETKRSRNAFIKDHVTFEDVMRRRKKTKEQKNRKNTYRYYLPLVKRRLEVCKKFFSGCNRFVRKGSPYERKATSKRRCITAGKIWSVKRIQ